MKFDRLVKQLITEAPIGDLPLDPRKSEEGGLERAGARHKIKATSDVGSRRSKAREIVGMGGEIDLEARKLEDPAAEASLAYRNIMGEKFNSAEELKTQLTKLADNLRFINDLNIDAEAKKIKIPNEENGIEKVSYLVVAKDVFDFVKNLFDKTVAERDSYPQQQWPIGWISSKEFQHPINILKDLTGEKLPYTMQSERSWNIFALDVQKSSPTHWEIIVRNKIEGVPESGVLRQTYGTLGKRGKWLQDRVVGQTSTVMKFINGVPQYGVACTAKELWSEFGVKYQKQSQQLPLHKLFDLVGFYTIWDVIYAKYHLNASTYEVKDAEGNVLHTIDLDNLTISYYDLSKPKAGEEGARFTKGIKVAETAPRKKIAPSPSLEDIPTGEEE